MHQFFLLVVLLSSFFSLHGAESSCPKKTTYIYTQEVQNSQSQTIWNIEKTKTTHSIQGNNTKMQIHMITSLDMETKHWSYHRKNQKNAYLITRNGSDLIVKCIQDKKISEKIFPIGKKRWIQEFNFSFRPFILGQAKRWNFYIVNPKTLTAYEMIASKIAPEIVPIKGIAYKTLRVKLTLAGFKKVLWKALLWFDLISGDLIKYRANEGPNTPMRIITLFEKQHDEGDDPKPTP